MDTIETLWGPGAVCGDETFGIAHHYVVHPLAVQILKDGKVASGGTLEYYMP